MARFRDIKTLQRFAAVQSAVHNHSNLERHHVSRSIFKKRRAAALAEPRQLTV